ncbi:MAG: glycerophosphodiester phosphodiesterase, partial [Bacillales bacterium]|nr:glycerophosphodiester phosphodiesterase [Bacillales bacterium]
LLDTQYQIPTLKEVLELSTTQKYLIETKQNFKDGLLEKATYELLKTYQGEYAIQSFNPYSVQWFYLNAPEVIRGQLGCSFKGNKEYSASQKKLYRTLEINKISQPHFVNYFFKETTNKVIMKARETMLILGWTVRSQKEYQKYEKYLDNITFENFKPTRRKNGI